MPNILTCRHCGHDALPPLPQSFNTHELKKVLRDGSIPSRLTVAHMELQVARLQVTIKEIEGAYMALVQRAKCVEEYITVARSLTSSIQSSIRKLPVELLSNVFLYVIQPVGDWVVDSKDMMLEAGIFDRHGSVGYRLASVCKYWWRVLHDTPVLHPHAAIRYHGLSKREALLMVRRYIKMTLPHPLRFCLFPRTYLSSDADARQTEERTYRAVVEELLNASSRWQIVTINPAGDSGLANVSNFETQIAAPVYRSLYSVLKELHLQSCSTSQFFLPEQVPALRVLRLNACPIALHALQPILLQITDLDLNCFNHDVDLHAILSCAPALIKLTVAQCDFPPCPPRIRSDVGEPFYDTRSPILLPHLHQLHIENSLLMLDFITAPGLSNLCLRDELSRFEVLEAFLCRSRCGMNSLDVAVYWANSVPRLVSLLCQVPYVTHLSIHTGGWDAFDVWNALRRHSSDGGFNVVPRLQHLEVTKDGTAKPSSRVISRIIRAVRKRCGARKVVVEGHTGYSKSRKTHVLRRLDINSPLTWSQHRTLLALSECGALDVCFTSNANPFVGNHGDDNYDESEDEDEDDEEDSDGGDNDGIVYI